MDQLPPSEASTCTIQSDKVFFNWTDTGGSTNCGQAQGLGRNIREEADSSWKHLLEIVVDADEFKYKVVVLIFSLHFF